MKTTIDLPNALLADAKRVARGKSTTLKALIEAGLRHEVREHSAAKRFRLRDESFRGRGLQPDATGLDWAGLRDLAYGEASRRARGR